MVHRRKDEVLLTGENEITKKSLEETIHKVGGSGEKKEREEATEGKQNAENQTGTKEQNGSYQG